MKKQIITETPVYLFLGFLESGKTKFIQETLEDKRFDSGEKTLLTEEIDKLYSTDELITYIYSAPKRVAASFAPAVYSAMRRGDDTALKIFSKNMRFAAEMIECASKRFPEGRIPVILAGGLTREAETLSAIKNALNKNDRFDIKTLDTSPVMGAVKLAMELFENE